MLNYLVLIIALVAPVICKSAPPPSPQPPSSRHSSNLSLFRNSFVSHCSMEPETP